MSVSLSLLVLFEVIQDVYQLFKVKGLTIYLKIKSLKIFWVMFPKQAGKIQVSLPLSNSESA